MFPSAKGQVAWLQKKANFLSAVTLAVGLPFCLWTLSQYGRLGGAGWWVYLVAVSFGGGLFGAWLLWTLYWKPTYGSMKIENPVSDLLKDSEDGKGQEVVRR